LRYLGDWIHNDGSFLVAAGPAVPNPSGNYATAGIYNGEPFYRRADDAYEIWFEPVLTDWLLGVEHTAPENGNWRCFTGSRGRYNAELIYVGYVDVVYYQPTHFMPDTVAVNQKGGGSSARYNRLRPNERPLPRPLEVRMAMRSVAKYWDNDLPIILRTEWLWHSINWQNQWGDAKFNRPYERFYNVNTCLVQAQRPMIATHTGRKFFSVGSVTLTSATAATQKLRTTTDTYRTFAGACYTVMLVYQVSPLAVDGRRSARYTRLLGAVDLDTDVFFPASENLVHDWPAQYPLIAGESAEVLIRLVNDYDAGPWPAIWAPHTLTLQPASIVIG